MSGERPTGRLLLAVAQRNEDEIKQLVDEGGHLEESYRGMTALMLAVMTEDSGHYRSTFGLNHANPTPLSLPLIKLLLEKKESCVNARDHSGMTALFHSVRGSNVETAKVLIEHGADVTTRDNRGQSVLHHLFLRGDHVQILRYLLSVGADPWAADCMSFTCVARMMQSPCAQEIVNLLVEHGVDLRDDRFVADNGSTLLHGVFERLTRGGKLKIQALLDQGFDINVENKLGQTPLRVAAENSVIPISGIWPLCDLGADPSIADHIGETALHVFIQKAGSGITSNFMKPTVERLLKAGADINSRNLFGLTPLHYAALHDNADAVNTLLKHNADWMIADRNGATPKHYAAAVGCIASLSTLIQCGSVDEVDDFNATVLDYALRNDQYEVTGLLAEAAPPPKHDINQDAYNGQGMVLNSDQVIAGDFSPLEQPRNLETFAQRVLLPSVCESQDTTLVQEAVWALITQLATRCKEVHPCLAFTPKLRGSMSEGTKFGPPDEFDVMLVFEELGKHFNPMVIGKRHAQLKYNGGGSIDKELPHLLESTNELNAEILGHVLRNIIGTALWCPDLWRCKNLSLKTFYKKTVCLYLELTWTSESFKMMTISVDLVPCVPLRIHPSKVLEIEWPLPLDPDQATIHILLPSCVHDEEFAALGYELSFTEVESQLMASLPEAARKGYTLAKALKSPTVMPAFKYADKGAVLSLNSKQSFLRKAGERRLEMSPALSGEDVLTSFMLKNALFWEMTTKVSQGAKIGDILPLEWTKLIYSHIQGSLLDKQLLVFITETNLYNVTREVNLIDVQEHNVTASWKTSLLYKRELPANSTPVDAATGFDLDPEDYRGKHEKRLVAVKIINHVLCNEH